MRKGGERPEGPAPASAQTSIPRFFNLVSHPALPCFFFLSGKPDFSFRGAGSHFLAPRREYSFAVPCRPITLLGSAIDPRLIPGADPAQPREIPRSCACWAAPAAQPRFISSTPAIYFRANLSRCSAKALPPSDQKKTAPHRSGNLPPAQGGV